MATTLLIARLNAKLQPMHRGEYFEEPLDEVLKKAGVGEISGGGTMQAKGGEIQYCDIEIETSGPSEATARLVIETLEALGAPQGSKLTIGSGGTEVAFGTASGLAVYLNGTDLPVEVYEKCDSNFVYDEFNRLLGEAGRVLSYWQGPTETALYMYGPSFHEMKARLSAFLAEYPLCQRCRVVQAA